MPWRRESLQTLIDRRHADIQARMPGTDPLVPFSLLGILGVTCAAAEHGLYGHQEYVAKQIVPDLADGEYLDRHAEWRLNDGRRGNVASTGNATFSGADGSTINAGEIAQRDDGVQFETTDAGVISGGVAMLAVKATDETLDEFGGALTDTAEGVTLTLVSTVPGVDPAAVVAVGGLTGGTDAEDSAQVISRMQDRTRNVPHGGALADYKTWALDVAGVTRAWVIRNGNGPGTVGVFFVRDNDASIVPDVAEVQAVQDYIDTVGPVPGTAFVVAPTLEPQDLTISLSPNTAAVQQAVTSALQDLFALAAVEDGNGTGKIKLSAVDKSISNADGWVDHVLVSPAVEIQPGAGGLATLGNITYQVL